MSHTKPHYWQRRNGTSYPSQIAALDCSLELGDVDTTRAQATFRVRDAALAIVRRGRGGVCRRRLVTGGGPAILEAIHSGCRGHAALWLWANDLYRQLVALGFLDCVDDKSWTLGVPRSDDPDAPRPEGERKFSGFAVLEDRLGILIAKRVGGGVLHAVDSRNYAVDDWTKILGDACNAPDREDWHYLMRLHGEPSPAAIRASALCSWACRWIDWCRAHDAGTMQMTLGSQAVYCYRKQFLPAPIVVHRVEDVNKLERRALYGGRCEAHFLGVVKSTLGTDLADSYYGGKVPCRWGVGTIYHLDVSSLYSAVCHREIMPSVLGDARSLHGITPAPDGWCRILEVTADLDRPVWPYRTPDGKRVVYPVGKVRTVVCEPEYQLAADRVTEVHRVVSYGGYRLFVGWGPALWKWRQEALEHGWRTIAGSLKVMCSVLYGKFAQLKRGWRHAPGVPPVAPWSVWHTLDRETREVVPYRAIAGRVERYYEGGETQESCPAITAYVNSLGRVWLWGAIQAAGRDHVYYCDTDSLWVDQSGYDALDSAGYFSHSGLGNLRIVARHKQVEFCGVKHYVADGQVTCAGLLPLTPAEREEAGRAWVPEQIQTAATAGRPPRATCRPAGRVYTRRYLQGDVQPDGRVTPFVFGGSE